MKLWAWLAISLAGIWLTPVVTWAQLAERATVLTDVTVEKRANVLRIRLSTDGPVSLQQSSGLTSQYKRIAFILPNSRYTVPDFINVDVFPVSHLEFAPSPDEPQDVMCTIVNYTEVVFAALGGQDYSQYASAGASRVLISNNSPTEILIQITLDRSNAGKDFTRTPAQCTVTGTRDSLTLKCINTKLGTVVDKLSEATQIPINLDLETEPAVSVNMENVVLERILDSIALGYGLNVAKTGQKIIVTTGVPKTGSSYALASQRTIQLQYLSSDECMKLLPQAALPMLKANEDGRSLVAAGTPMMLDKIVRDVAVIDQPSYHVNLQVTTISSDATDDVINSIDRLLFDGHTKIDLPEQGISVSAGKTNSNDMLASLQGLLTSRVVTIKSAPGIQVINGETASLFVGQTINLIVESNGNANLTAIDAGTMLNVTPHTSSEWVNLTTKVENSFLQEENSLGPLISSQKVNTTLRIKSGDTLIIGGLRVKTEEVQREKIPLALRRFKVSADIPTKYRSNKAVRATWVLLSATTSATALANPRKMNEVLR